MLNFEWFLIYSLTDAIEKFMQVEEIVYKTRWCKNKNWVKIRWWIRRISDGVSNGNTCKYTVKMGISKKKIGVFIVRAIDGWAWPEDTHAISKLNDLEQKVRSKGHEPEGAKRLSWSCSEAPKNIGDRVIDNYYRFLNNSKSDIKRAISLCNRPQHESICFSLNKCTDDTCQTIQQSNDTSETMDNLWSVCGEKSERVCSHTWSVWHWWVQLKSA